MSIEQLRPFHVQAWCDSHDWNDTTKNNAITAVKRALNWGVKMGYCSLNPIARMEKPAPKTRTEVITQAEYELILSHYEDQQFRDLIQFSWETWMRPHEVRRLEARHVDLAQKRIVYPYTEGKSRRVRVAYLTDVSEAIAARLIKENPEGALFRNRAGRPWTPYAVHNRFCRLEYKVGKKFYPYMFRHGGITRSLRAGVDSRIVAQLAGHSSTKMLDKVYSHITDDPQFMSAQMGRSSGPESAATD